VSADKITDTHVGTAPAVKMTVIPKMDSIAIQVEVFRKTDSGYKLMLVELINYDVVTNQIVALGQNEEGKCFTRKGYFYSDNKWVMKDYNYKGELVLNVSFEFISSTAIVLKGVIPNAKGWEIKYIKVSPKKAAISFNHLLLPGRLQYQ
jgi:hypothetical protein